MCSVWKRLCVWTANRKRRENSTNRNPLWTQTHTQIQILQPQIYRQMQTIHIQVQMQKQMDTIQMRMQGPHTNQTQNQSPRSNRHTPQKNTHALLPRYGCLERQPRTHTIFFGIVRFKHTHPRYPKTPLLASGVHRYGCLERHPRTDTIPFGVSNTTILGTPPPPPLFQHVKIPNTYVKWDLSPSRAVGALRASVLNAKKALSPHFFVFFLSPTYLH